MPLPELITSPNLGVAFHAEKLDSPVPTSYRLFDIADPWQRTHRWQIVLRKAGQKPWQFKWGERIFVDPDRDDHRDSLSGVAKTTVTTYTNWLYNTFEANVKSWHNLTASQIREQLQIANTPRTQTRKGETGVPRTAFAANRAFAQKWLQSCRLPERPGKQDSQTSRDPYLLIVTFEPDSRYYQHREPTRWWLHQSDHLLDGTVPRNDLVDPDIAGVKYHLWKTDLAAAHGAHRELGLHFWLTAHPDLKGMLDVPDLLGPALEMYWQTVGWPAKTPKSNPETQITVWPFDQTWKTTRTVYAQPDHTLTPPGPAR